MRRRKAVDEIFTQDAVFMIREEGLFAGTSTGANVLAALRLAEQLGPRATVVSILCDTGMKYLRTYGAELSKREDTASRVIQA